MQTERRVAANLQTQPTDLGCESADEWLLSSTSTIAICFITQPDSLYSFYRPTDRVEGISRPRHCRKGAQPVPKAVMPSLNHCDLQRHVGVNNLPKVVTRQRRGRN